MKIVGVIVGVVVFIGILPLLIGLFIPSERTYTKEFVFDSSVEKVWNIVTDLKGQERWRSDVKVIKIISNENGNEVWIEIPQKGPSIKFRTVEKIENKSWTMEIIDNPSFTGKWVGTFEAVDKNTTKVVFTESPLITNPYMRTLSLIFVNMDKTMELYLENLEIALGGEQDEKTK